MADTRLQRRIKRLRASLHCTQRRLARLLGIRADTLGKLERGASVRPTTRVLVALRRVESAYAEELAMIAQASEGLSR